MTATSSTRSAGPITASHSYDEAVKQLERAVELKPEDPTINDHLGDAYWKIGRTLEATFQWAHARDLKPDPDDLKKIEEKIRTGLARRSRHQPRPPSRQEARRRRLTFRRRVGRSARTDGVRSRQGQSDAARARPAADGYHEIESLVAFADVGRPADACSRRARSTSQCHGPTAAAAGDDADNLVLKAARALAERVSGLRARPFRTRQAASGRGGPRRRLLRCRGGAAVACAP